MAVVFEGESGWFVDHEQSINKTCQPCDRVYKSKDGLFDIHHPFLMDSQFLKLQQLQSMPKESQSVVKKKRKRKQAKNGGEIALEETFKEIRNLLLTALDQLVEIGRSRGCIHNLVKELLDNNQSARTTASIRSDDYSLQYITAVAKDWSKDDKNHTEVILNDESKVGELSDIVNKLVHHRADKCRVVKLSGEEYLVPANASFLLSDITCLQPLVLGGKQYDLIVMDPPWENKSLKRKKMYNTLNDEALLLLPVQQLVKDGTLVVVWVTNREQHQHFVLNKLFPVWNVTVVVKWYWLKVTISGIPVYELDSPHRKPYEMLLIGIAGDCDMKLPADKVIMSIPCSVHSRKPPLLDILQRYLPQDPQCLELFARNLNSTWTSWGNEVLFYQHKDFYNLEAKF